MDGAISDSSPKVLLHPDALPQLHSIYAVRDEEPSSEDVLSTVDIAALKDAGADQGFHMGNTWRSTATPRRREKPVEVHKNDQQICNGLKAPCHSEESQESDGSNSDSDSDDSDSSKSCSSSGSSSNCGSSCSSASSDSSDSESDEKSSSSQSSKAASKASTNGQKGPSRSVPLVNGGGDHAKASTKSLYHRVKKKGYASSSDSRSSRDKKRKNRKEKNFSVSDYSSGSLKLKIAALKPPNQRVENNFTCGSTPRVPSPWLSEDSSNETRAVVAVDRQKSKPKGPPVPELALSLSSSPHKKPSSSSPEKKPIIISSSPSQHELQSSKYSTKSNSWCNAGSPEKKSVIVVSPSLPSPETDRPKKKNKLSCLMTSISPKAKTKTSNGTALMNGDGRHESKVSSPVPSGSPQKHLPNQEESYNHSSQTTPNHSPRKMTGLNIRSSSSSSSGTTPNHHLNNVHCNSIMNNNYTSSTPPNPGQIITPVRTKAAKKYIPDDHLVIPQVVVTPPTPVATPKKTKADDASHKKKKKVKKSSSKDKKKKEKKKKKPHKKTPPEPEGFKDVCNGITSLLLKDGSDKVSRAATTSVQQKPREPYIFELRKFDNIDETMSKFSHPAPPRSNSFPRTPVASTSHTGTGRKRKLNIVNDRMKEASQSTQLQRLPLKKRHHHASSVDKSNSADRVFSKEQKFGTEPGFTRPTFDIGNSTSSSTSTFNVRPDTTLDFGDLLRSPSQSTSTHSSSKENEIEAIPSRSSSVGAKRKSQGGASTKKQRQSVASRKQSPLKKKQAIVSPDICDAPDSARRTSGRIRKPRKLDLEVESQETSTSPARTPNSQKAILNSKPPKREVKKIKIENVSVVAPPVPEVIVVEAPSTQVVPRGRGRKRNMPTTVEEVVPVPTKKSKGAPVIECDSSLNESEISTEVETDGEAIIMSPPSSATATPLTSPLQQQQQPKKRRKVNRTGFPSVKKKKKSIGVSKSVVTPSSTPTPVDSADSRSATPAIKDEPLSTAASTAPSSAQLTIDKKDDGVVVISKVKKEDSDDIIEVKAEPTPSHSSAAFTNMLSTSGFTFSLSERVKMRKRASLDDRLALGEEAGSESRPEIPGLILDLVHMSNPPVVVPPKNNHLPCGLLSNFFKSMDPNQRYRSLPEQNNPVLVMPPDPESAEFTTTVLRDYMLPHDIWCMGVLRARNLYEAWEQQRREEEEIEKAEIAALKKEEAAIARKERRKSEFDTASVASSTENTKPKKLKMPEKLPSSWSFRRLKSNTYYGFAKPPTSTEFESSCTCREGPMKCSSDDCLNRVVYTECPISCGDNCKNRRIQKHEWAPGIKRLLTEEKGYGVFALEGIKKGSFILEYVGEVVAEAVFKERMHTIYAGDTHHYCLHLDGGLVIDGHRSGGEGRFVNHSCEPNCEMQKWSVNGLSRMALFALRDIDPNEELSYDYNFSLFNPSEGQPCYCGSTNCRGVIGIRTKAQKNGESNSKSKRKGKGLVTYLQDPDKNKGQEPFGFEKMKQLTKKDRIFVQKRNCFLIRNYEKIRKLRHDTEGQVNLGDRLEKVMVPWSTRYKIGSTKNKPPQVPEDDVKLVRLARIAQIFYELYIKLTAAKDESGALLCQPFMSIPTKRKCPQLHAAMEEPLDLTLMCKKILRGDYRNLNQFELDLGLVLTNFDMALQKDKPGISENVQKIKTFYKGLKAKVMDELEPFIVHKGSKGSIISNDLPPFRQIDVDPKVDDMIRCICDRFSDEGWMVQCDTCCVWQHCDCMRVPHSNRGERKGGNRRNKKQPRRSKFFSPVVTSAGESTTSSPVKPVTVFSTPLASPSFASPSTSASTSANTTVCSVSTLSPRLNTRPLALREEQVHLELMDMSELILNVKDPIPMEIKEDSNHSVDLATSSTADQKGSTNPVDLSEMETQRIDVDGDVEVNGPPPDMVVKNVSPVSNGKSEEVPYYCEVCDPRPVDREVRLIRDDDTPEKTHYTTLLRDDGFMIRRNDTVYVLRDPPTPPGQQVIDRPTYRTAGPLVPKDCDIFRVEMLWKDQNGKRFAYGHHYVRPSETYHEHNRRFYRNEICRSPIFEAIPIDLIHGRCWVLDPATYCKGRPVGCNDENHVYICEWRVDKSNRSFSKAGKGAHAVCMKPFAFQYFETKILITRNYHPHGVPSPDFKQKPVAVASANSQEKGKSKKGEEKMRSGKMQSTLERLKASRRKGEQKERLKKILELLKNKVTDGDRNRIDLSGLLGRQKQVKKLTLPS